MTPDDTESTTARATAACAGPNICTACLAPLMVTLLNISVSGLAGRLGATTASSVVNPSLLFDSAWQNACPATPDFDPMMRSMCATSFPSPTRDSPMKKSAAMVSSSVLSWLLSPHHRVEWPGPSRPDRDREYANGPQGCQAQPAAVPGFLSRTRCVSFRHA